MFSSQRGNTNGSTEPDWIHAGLALALRAFRHVDWVFSHQWGLKQVNTCLSAQLVGKSHLIASSFISYSGLDGMIFVASELWSPWSSFFPVDLRNEPPMCTWRLVCNFECMLLLCWKCALPSLLPVSEFPVAGSIHNLKAQNQAANLPPEMPLDELWVVSVTCEPTGCTKAGFQSDSIYFNFVVNLSYQPGLPKCIGKSWWGWHLTGWRFNIILYVYYRRWYILQKFTSCCSIFCRLIRCLLSRGCEARTWLLGTGQRSAREGAHWGLPCRRWALLAAGSGCLGLHRDRHWAFQQKRINFGQMSLRGYSSSLISCSLGTRRSEDGKLDLQVSFYVSLWMMMPNQATMTSGNVTYHGNNKCTYGDQRVIYLQQAHSDTMTVQASRLALHHADLSVRSEEARLA